MENQKVIVDGFKFYYGLKRSLLPDVVYLNKYDYDLHIPEKRKQYRS